MAHPSETQPLLDPSPRHRARSNDPPTGIPAGYPDSLPGAAHGKTLSWTSAYILVVSRVIGSGIFATPGSIVKSAGSVGLTLLVWLVGTVLAACGLAISMEYGCMLPRSGGDKVDLLLACPLGSSAKTRPARCTWSIPIVGRGSLRRRWSRCRRLFWASRRATASSSPSIRSLLLAWSRPSLSIRCLRWVF